MSQAPKQKADPLTKSQRLFSIGVSLALAIIAMAIAKNVFVGLLAFMLLTGVINVIIAVRAKKL